MLKIEYVKTAELKPYGNNAKLHPAEQVEQIKKSIQEFGFNDPIAVWKDNEIIEGHGRLIAADELGIKDVPVIRLDNLSDEERRAYMLVHNQLTMNTGFDFALLEEELADLDIDMSMFGFTENSLDDFFSSGEDEPVERVDDYEEKHVLEVRTEKRGKYDALIAYMNKNEIEWEEK